ncbi:MAG TPA: FkbM family methyltransferase [Cytophagaceae bacterium]|nr:FkbM family methyltransferase [Cytophagaceae bacterium]
MSFNFVRIFRKVTRGFGLLIRKYDASTNEDARLLKLLEHYKIDYVLDIGANVGQYAMALIDQGFKKNIISFEPLENEYKQLLKESKNHPNWTIYEKCALGGTESEMTINISKNSYSSSLLPMLDSHKKSAPDSAYVRTEKIKVYRLDDVIKKLNIPTQNLFMKLDVQGFEHEVLEGAQETLKTCKGVQIEVSLVPLYEGTKYYFDDYLTYFKEKGFELIAIHPVFTDKNTGQVLQCDLTYFRK